MANMDVKQAIKEHRITQWQVADCLQVSEQTLIRWLRKELSPDKKARVYAAIQAVAGRKAKEA